MAGEGEFENEWNKLLGFKRARVSTEGPVDVEAALCAIEGGGVEEDFRADEAFPPAFPDSRVLFPTERLLRSEPKLRAHDGATRHLREARLCNRAEELEDRAPWRITWRHWAQV